MSATTLVTGNTYPHREALKALGGRWDAANMGWRVPASRAEETTRLIAETAVAGATYRLGGRDATYPTEAAAIAAAVQIGLAATPGATAVIGISSVLITHDTGATTSLELRRSPGACLLARTDSDLVYATILCDAPRPTRRARPARRFFGGRGACLECGGIDVRLLDSDGMGCERCG